MPALLVIFVLLLTGCQDRDQPLAAVRLPDGACYLCEIADTDFKHGVGLSRHESMAPDRGMLFVYPRDQRHSFWMPPQMRFSLDIIFLDSDYRVIHIAHSAPPCPDPSGYDCPSYGPDSRRGRYVLELNAGEAARHGLKDGDKIEVEYPEGYKFPWL